MFCINNSSPWAKEVWAPRAWKPEKRRKSPKNIHKTVLVLFIIVVHPI
jgi:hypothetical protein